MDLHYIVRAMSRSEDVCSNITDDFLDLVLNEDGASTLQGSDESEPVQLTVIVNQVTSSESSDNSDANLAGNSTQNMQWTSLDIICGGNALGKMRCAESPSV